MPGPIVTDALRDLLAGEIATAIAGQFEDDLDTEKLRTTARDAIAKLQSKQTLAIRLEDEDGNERTLSVQDLPVGVIDELARKHDVAWLMVTDYPLQHTRVGLATDLIRATAKQLKIKEPRGLTPRQVVDAFVSVPDDVHHEEGGGSGPLPISDGDET